MVSVRTLTWRFLVTCCVISALLLGALCVCYPALVRDLYTDVANSGFSDFKHKVEFYAYFTERLSSLEKNSQGNYVLPKPKNRDNKVYATLQDAQLTFDRSGDIVALDQLRERASAPDESLLLWHVAAHLKLAFSELQNVVLEQEQRAGLTPALEHQYNSMKSDIETDYVRHLDAAQRSLGDLIQKRRLNLYLWLQTVVRVLKQTDPAYAGQQLLRAFLNINIAEQWPDESSLDNPIFHDVTHELGIEEKSPTKGVAVEDFDNDGFLDVVTASSFDSIKYYKNVSGVFFHERTQDAGLSKVTQAYHVSAVDYNNDGHMDLFVSRPFHHYQLFRNAGDGSFVDITKEVGLYHDDAPLLFQCTWHATWGDIDNDGDLDLFLSQWGQQNFLNKGLYRRKPASSVLFRNEDGFFRDVTKRLGLSAHLDGENIVSAAFGDYDSDGYVDLFVSSFSRNITSLYRNRFGQGFLKSDGFSRAAPGFMTAFLDMNNDGSLDIFQAGNTQAKSSYEHLAAGSSGGAPNNVVHVQQYNSGVFKENRNAFQGSLPLTTLGVTWGDVNNDGCLDFYMGTGNPELWFIAPNLIYLGERQDQVCTGSVRPSSYLSDLSMFEKGQAAVFFDYDNDGDEDLYAGLGGMWPGDAAVSRLYRNEITSDARFVKIRLRGTRTNRFGVGVKVRIVRQMSSRKNQQTYHVMGNKTGYGSAPYLIHSGIGDALNVYAEVFWSPERIERYDLDLNTMNTLVEFSGKPHTLEDRI